MKTFTQAVIGLCLLVIAVPLVWWGSAQIPLSITMDAVAAVPASSHVKVLTAGGGHGSGTHIGEGYILSAGHVADDAKTLQILADNGSEYTADVLWSNREFDVALLRLQTDSSVGITPLSCAANPVGQRVRAYGSPANKDFVYTVGEVVGKPAPHPLWRSVIPVDMTIIPGMSGGGVLNQAGELVGITVGVMVYYQGLTGIGYVVPATVACTLMGRTA